MHPVKALLQLALSTLLLAPLASIAANIALLSSDNSPADFAALTPSHTVTAVSVAQIDAGTLSNYDVLLFGHAVYQGDGSGFSATTCNQIQTFLNSGGGMVVEWNAVSALFTQAQGIYVPTEVSCNLFAGTAADGDSTYGSNQNIDTAISGSPLLNGLTNPFSMGSGSQFLYLLTGLGAEWHVAGTVNAGGTDYPAVMGARYNGSGCVAVTPFDHWDELNGGDADADTLIQNMVSVALPPGNSQVCGMAVTAPQSIPTLSEWGMLLLSSLLALGAIVILRRQRL